MNLMLRGSVDFVLGKEEKESLRSYSSAVVLVVESCRDNQLMD